MLLDIGAKTSNLLFFEKGKVYSRSINLGANSITQDFANESKLPWAGAEEKKISEGFVSLGGAYEEPENAHQAAISKIARQFMTRLHIQVNQTMQFYRGQQGGAAPQRLFLSGGASLMPYTAQFFAEKLQIPVEYFNPFRNVQIDPSVNLEELAQVAHSLGEVVGLGLRNLAHCPVELNLMPESTVNWVQFNQKKPYLLASVFSLALVVFAAGFMFQKLNAVNGAELENIKKLIQPLQTRQAQFKQATDDLGKSVNNATQLAGWVNDRYYWADAMAHLHQILIQVESNRSSQLGQPVGLWIERFIVDPEHAAVAMTTPTPEPSPQPADQQPAEEAPVSGDTARMRQDPVFQSLPPMQKDYYSSQPDLWFKYGRAQYAPKSSPPPPAAVSTPAAPATGTPAKPKAGPAVAGGSGVQEASLSCRAVDMAGPADDPSFERDLINDFVNALRQDPLFDPATEITNPNNPWQPNADGTFSFDLTLKLRRPLDL